LFQSGYRSNLNVVPVLHENPSERRKSIRPYTDGTCAICIVSFLLNETLYFFGELEFVQGNWLRGLGFELCFFVGQLLKCLSELLCRVGHRKGAWISGKAWQMVLFPRFQASTKHFAWLLKSINFDIHPKLETTSTDNLNSLMHTREYRKCTLSHSLHVPSRYKYGAHTAKIV